MNNINPNNYDGANITVVGRAGGEPQRKDFNGGGSISELSIAVSQGYKKDGEWVDTGTTWYTLTASGDYAADNWPVVGKGDKVRVDDGRLETREFTRKDGSTGQQFQIRFGTLTVVESKSAKTGGDGFIPEDDGFI